uniref:ATP synthase peripheral stalk subunit F6, mitochondrial n=1 Tax=Prolemur simus TaxID=1328070 RepID=A0A8C9DP51_PROSS
MILQAFGERFTSALGIAVSVHLRRNVGVTAVAFNKELDLVRRLSLDKIREYKSKRLASGGPFDIGSEYQQELERKHLKHKQMAYARFPCIKIKWPHFECIQIKLYLWS